jgi:hypothetical protein
MAYLDHRISAVCPDEHMVIRPANHTCYINLPEGTSHRNGLANIQFMTQSGSRKPIKELVD